MQLPLSGYRVLDLSRYGPGPYCSMLLGDLGAEIVVVDDGSPAAAHGRRQMGSSPDADITSPLNFMRRNAQRIALDLKHPDGQFVIRRLVERSDVLIESYRPGVAAKLGLGQQELRERHPRLIYCSISGYGQSGPYRDWQGHDINYLALGGLLALTGLPTSPPVLPGTLVADLAGGGLPATVTILGALLSRERSGLGQFIDVSLQEGVVGLLSPMIALAAAGWEIGAGASVLTGGAPWYRVYSTSDGKHVAVGAIEPWLFAELCARLDHPEWTSHQYDRDLWPTMAQEMARIFRAQPVQYWRDELESAGVCLTQVSELDDVLDDPQLRHRGTFDPGNALPGNIRSLPIMSGMPDRTPRQPSEPGGDAETILADAGFSPEEQQRLRASGGVA